MSAQDGNVNTTVASAHAREVSARERFEFGENWARFLRALDEPKVAASQAALAAMLEVADLRGRRFVDVGSGSGLSSLAAFRLGAQVHSFDYDPNSVACTRELRRREGADDSRWTVEPGSALDPDYLRRLGTFDVVYSWGVLHHTGDMWRALELVTGLVAEGGKLFIAIYNDQGSSSRRWLWIKRTYNRLPPALRPAFAALVVAPGEIKSMVRYAMKGRLGDYFRYGDEGATNRRGMTRWRDIIDWVGGYPFEVATPDEIFDFYRARGFTLTKLKCGGVGSGCNEFVFQRR